MGEQVYQYYSTVKAQPVDWLWYPYIPYGKLTLLQGDPGEGKSTFALQLAAALTQGKPLPDGTSAGDKATVIYQCAEDNNEDTIKPRLISAGADCERVAFIKDGDDTLTLDDQRISEALERTSARLLIIDPIQSYIRQDGDMQSATRMRTILRRLSSMAEKYRCAMILIGHLNKASGGKNIYRGLGSIDITAIARSVLMIVRDKENPDIRYMVTVKQSLAPEGPPVGFILDQDTGFHWIGRCSIPNEEKVITARSKTKKEMARDLLKVMLSAGAVESKEVFKRMESLNISERTVRSAQHELGVVPSKHRNVWYLSLPEDEGISEHEEP